MKNKFATHKYAAKKFASGRFAGLGTALTPVFAVGESVFITGVFLSDTMIRSGLAVANATLLAGTSVDTRILAKQDRVS
jgi:hypothetical protein